LSARADEALRAPSRRPRLFQLASVKSKAHRQNSDIDLLVEMDPGRTLLDLIALDQDLEELLGRPVEVP